MYCIEAGSISLCFYAVSSISPASTAYRQIQNLLLIDMASISNILYASLLTSLVHGCGEDTRHQGAAAAGAVPVSQYLNSFSIEFKNLPDFAGVPPPLSTPHMSLTLNDRKCIQPESVLN